MKLKQSLKNNIVKICRRLGETSPLLLDWREIGDCKNAVYLLDTMRLAKYLVPVEAQAPEGKRIIILAPHPDDEVIGMGGTLIKMLQNGCRVKVVYFTLADHPELRQESEDLARHLGFEACYLGFEKHNISLKNENLKKLTSVISEFEPDEVFLPFLLDDHDDHRRVSEFMQSAFKSGFLDSLTKSTIWAYQVYTSLPLNTVIDISETIEPKCDAIRYYNSQFISRDWAHFAKGLNAFNVRFLPCAKKDLYCEVFYRCSLKNYITLCDTYFGQNPENCYEYQNYKTRG